MHYHNDVKIKKDLPKFTRVTVDHDICGRGDGSPFIRKCSDSECLMSFYDDDGGEAFVDFATILNDPFSRGYIGSNRSFHQEDELCITPDGIAFSDTFEFEYLMKFDSDNGKDLFLKWWDDYGSSAFYQFHTASRLAA